MFILGMAHLKFFLKMTPYFSYRSIDMIAESFILGESQDQQRTLVKGKEKGSILMSHLMYQVWEMMSMLMFVRSCYSL